MNSPEDFKNLRTLLALKAREIPPPAYFSQLHLRILARIEQEHAALLLPWWQRMFVRVDAQPLLAGAYAFGVSGLLLIAFFVSESPNPEAAFGLPASFATQALFDNVPSRPPANLPVFIEGRASFSPASARTLFEGDRISAEPISASFTGF